MRRSDSKMPMNIGEVYDGLYLELAWYRRTLEAFYDLYVEKPDNIAIFNELAPDFFGFLQDTLIDSLVIRLSRITDSAATRNYDNLSFRQLLILIDRAKYPALHDKVSAGIDRLDSFSDAARKHRNKRVAHIDLTVSKASGQLPGLIAKDFKAALQVANEILNYVTVEFDEYEVASLVAPAPGGPQSLIHALRRAKELKASDPKKYYLEGR